MTSTCLLAAYPNLVPRAFPNFKGKSPVSFSSMSMVQCVKCSNHAFSFELLPNVQDEFVFIFTLIKVKMENVSVRNHTGLPQEGVVREEVSLSLPKHCMEIHMAEYLFKEGLL